MTDVFNNEKRSEIMRSIHSKDTQPELAIRKMLHSLGYRYLLHDKRMPGSPDLVLPKYKTVIQIRGCFWHQHGCKKSRIPKTNVQYWKSKLHKNVVRDQMNDKLLSNMGWKVIIVWECETQSTKKIEATVDCIVNKLQIQAI
jgi:DNA mismatch endonuclease, patch repair protein